MSLRVYRSPKTHDYHWQVLSSSRGRRILADSGEGYKRKGDCERGAVLTCRELTRAIVGLKPKP